MIKYKFTILIMVILIIFSINEVTAKNNKRLDLFGKVITIDAGHGGRDPGTMYGKVLEKDLNLLIAKRLEKELISRGAIVHMIRDKDEDLSLTGDYRKKRSDLYRRIKIIKKNKSDLYLSIHLNWYNNSYFRGVEVLYNNINKTNKVLAQSITNSFDKNNIKTREIRITNLYIYRNITTPGVLIECGFLSNSNDRYLLQRKYYQKKISKIITDGVIDYFK